MKTKNRVYFHRRLTLTDYVSMSNKPLNFFFCPQFTLKPKQKVNNESNVKDSSTAVSFPASPMIRSLTALHSPSILGEQSAPKGTVLAPGPTTALRGKEASEVGCPFSSLASG